MKFTLIALILMLFSIPALSHEITVNYEIAQIAVVSADSLDISENEISSEEALVLHDMVESEITGYSTEYDHCLLIPETSIQKSNHRPDYLSAYGGDGEIGYTVFWAAGVPDKIPLL